MDYEEKRRKGLIIDATNIHLFAKRIDVDESRAERANKCSWCGTFVPEGYSAPGGLCRECNKKADWDDEPGEDYDVGMGIEFDNHSFFGADEEEEPDVGF